MPTEETFSISLRLRRRCRVIQSSPAPPEKINRPRDELSEKNIGGQHPGHDEVEQRTLENQRAPEPDAPPAQLATEQTAGPDPAQARQRERQPDSPLVLAERQYRNGHRPVGQRRLVKMRHIPE